MIKTRLLRRCAPRNDRFNEYYTCPINPVHIISLPHPLNPPEGDLFSMITIINQFPKPPSGWLGGLENATTGMMPESEIA